MLCVQVCPVTGCTCPPYGLKTTSTQKANYWQHKLLVTHTYTVPLLSTHSPQGYSSWLLNDITNLMQLCIHHTTRDTTRPQQFCPTLAMPPKHLQEPPLSCEDLNVIIVSHTCLKWVWSSKNFLYINSNYCPIQLGHLVVVGI